MRTLAVMTTIDSLDGARQIARAMVDRKLAACAQISEIESFYHWQGHTENGKEYRVLLKTATERYAAVEEAIREVHPYELPAIVAFDLSHAFGPYADWIIANSAGAPD